MREKEVSSKNKNINYSHIIFLLLILTCFLAKAGDEDKNYRLKILEYLSNNKEFSSSFIQYNDDALQEGEFFLKKNRLRIEYSAPTQIVFVIKDGNAMYYNLDLKEVEYFNPKNTVAKIFFDFFYDKKFLEGVKFNNENNSFDFVKKIKIKDEVNNIKIIFEKSPIKLRKIEISNSEGFTSFAIINANYNPVLDDKMFSLANPLLN
jgi:outer membrane lipoprotein-sorting protein